MGEPSDSNCGGNQMPQYPPYTSTFALDPMPSQPQASQLPPFYMPPFFPPPWPNQTSFQQSMVHEPAPPVPPAFNETNASPPPGRTKKTKSRGAGSRGPSYTIEEDKALCSAYLNVSRDPIVGAFQTSETYWERIANYYNENNKFRTKRTPDSLSTRWHTIAKDTSRFCAIKAEVDRRRESGKNEEDKEHDALELFLGRVGRPFQFMHCWVILRNTRKWQDWIATKPADTGADRDDRDAEDAQDIDPAAQELPRPIGRDQAKKKRRTESGQSSESSACLELFQQMAKERELKNQLQASVASELKEMHARTLAAQEERLQKQLEIQQEHNRKQLELEQEKFRWKQKTWEADQLEKDNRIMMMDLNSLSGVARDYFKRLQMEIIQKRWGGGGSSSDVN